MNQQPNLILN